MLIVLNVAREFVDPLNDWTACEGVRLVERADGTFDLQVSRDLAQTLRAEAEIRRADAHIADILEGRGPG
jgi:hypothetical protein